MNYTIEPTEKAEKADVAKLDVRLKRLENRPGPKKSQKQPKVVGVSHQHSEKHRGDITLVMLVGGGPRCSPRNITTLVGKWTLAQVKEYYK